MSLTCKTTIRIPKRETGRSFVFLSDKQKDTGIRITLDRQASLNQMKDENQYPY